MSTTTQQPAPDFGEPWKHDTGSVYEKKTGMLICDTYCASAPASVCKKRADRIIACVNACSGMADPAKEIAELRAYAQRCKDGCISLSHSIDRIDYACGEPNEMGVSDYCIHQNDEAVVERVKSKMAEIQAMRERIDNLEASGIHSCGDHCKRPLCVANREKKAMREAIKEACGMLSQMQKCEDSPDIDIGGEMQVGLHCGVEDRCCSDRYEGADFGYAQGVERTLKWAVDEASLVLAKLQPFIKP